MTGRVIVVGSLNVDVTVVVDRPPRPGETVLGGALRRGFGGKGGNQAVAAALAGSPTVMVGAVGDDPDGAAYRDRLARLGVDTSSVARRPRGVTGTALITLSADGENAIVVAPGANGTLTKEDIEAAVDASSAGRLRPADVVLVSLEVPLDVACHAVRLAHRAGARAIVNAAPYADLPDDVLAADPLVVNEHEAALLGDRAPESCLVTMGARGATWRGVHIAAVPTIAVDSTGAGDTFCGALASALAAGLTERDAMAAAAEAASRAVTWLGAQPPQADFSEGDFSDGGAA